MQPRPAKVRFYVDEDALGLGKALGDVRIDVTYPGDLGRVHKRRQRHPCTLIQRGALDPDWIPKVAQAGWVIITRDANIQAHPSHMDAVRRSGARLVTLAAKEAVTPWDQLRLVAIHWDAIEVLTTATGPHIYSVTRTRFRELPL